VSGKVLIEAVNLFSRGVELDQLMEVEMMVGW
jgi:hypothetical protein